MRSHLLNARTLDPIPVQAFRLKAVKRLVKSEFSGQAVKEQRTSGTTVYAEKGRLGTTGLYGN
ncbi:MAG: hypothetical protein DMG86_21520 [Acidobacteria bacterium]|nr:MAG: hypothetical protein DMG86_21520 [Acidobacteriota bacterium]